MQVLKNLILGASALALTANACLSASFEYEPRPANGFPSPLWGFVIDKGRDICTLYANKEEVTCDIAGNSATLLKDDTIDSLQLHYIYPGQQGGPI